MQDQELRLKDLRVEIRYKSMMRNGTKVVGSNLTFLLEMRIKSVWSHTLHACLFHLFGLREDGGWMEKDRVELARNKLISS